MNPHYTNTDNPIDFPKMTKYIHIVQIHPVQLGKPNLAKVVEEREFDNVDDARFFRMDYNQNPKQDRHGYPTQAVYHGRVNDETGELE